MRYTVQKPRLTLLIMIGTFLMGSTIWMDSIAQEDEYILTHADIFGKLRRPPVMFSHELHTEALEGEGCGACHHTQDENNGKLVYKEGEELSCWECHGLREDNQTPPLQRAYHGSCTGCHRRLIKQKKPDSGPTTCGGCHVKP